MKNTAIEYSYTDYGNWDARHRIVIAGEMTSEMIAKLKTHLIKDMCFNHPDPEKYGQIIPGQIGLKDLQSDVGNPGRDWDDNDHIFHVVEDISQTDEAPTYSDSAFTVQYLVDRIASTKWDLTGYEPPLMQSMADEINLSAWT